METKNNEVIIEALRTHRRFLIDKLSDYMKNDIAQPMYKGADIMELKYSQNNISSGSDDSLIYLAAKVSTTLQDYIKEIGMVDETIKGLE